MPAKRRFPRLILFIALACFALPWCLLRLRDRFRHAAQPSTYRFPFAGLAQLDRVVQARFAVIPRDNFGMARIGPRHDLFRPASAVENTAIGNLRNAGYDVVYYVAGRNYLLSGSTNGYRSFLQGPIYMTQKPALQVVTTQGRYEQPVFHTQAQPAGLPAEDFLREPLTNMLASSSRWDRTATPDGHDFEAGKWHAVAVPVRASSQACVNCHRYFSRSQNWGAPGLGEPLGISLYLYRKRTELVSRPKIARGTH